MGRSSREAALYVMRAAGVRAAAVSLVIASAAGAAGAADLCEGCWELGGRGAYLGPSGASGMDPSPGPGIFGSFRFRPFWSVDFSFDRHASQVSNGPDETLEIFTAVFEYTFRSERDQRTRPYAFFGGGLLHDGVGTGTAQLGAKGRQTATSSAAADTALTYALGAGGLTLLTERTSLRYEVRILSWSTFGTGQSAVDFIVGLGFRLGR